MARPDPLIGAEIDMQVAHLGLLRHVRRRVQLVSLPDPRRDEVQVPPNPACESVAIMSSTGRMAEADALLTAQLPAIEARDADWPLAVVLGIQGCASFLLIRSVRRSTTTSRSSPTTHPS